ncbi:MAG TPA: MFS transporter, partial [Terrimicrobiaceae bacterium]
CVKTELPPGRFSAHWMSFLGALSFQIMMGGPIIVFAKSLGASSTVLGLVAALTPLLTLFQLPAARSLNRYGYRRVVLMGWNARIVLIVVISALPLLGFLDSPSKITALLILLVFVHILRNISAVAWAPWVTQWIPEPLRGRFLSIDQFFMYGGSLAALFISGVLISEDASPWDFSLVFLLSAAAATIGLPFIMRMPDLRPVESHHDNPQKVSWRGMFAYRPFRELVIYNVLFGSVLGSLGVFTLEFLHERSDFDVGTMLHLLAASYAGSLLTLPFCGPIADTVGSKPMMRVVTILFGVILLLWGLIAGGVLACSYALVGALNFLTGVATANFRLANSRINMSTMPEKGRQHFFAMFAVVSNLGLGAAPILWGIILQHIRSFDFETAGFHWRSHSIFFLALLMFTAISFAYIKRLHEPHYSPPPKGPR